MKKLLLILAVILSLPSFAQIGRLRQQRPSSDTIYFSKDYLESIFSKQVGDTVGADKITFKNDSVIQFVPKRFNKAVATITRIQGEFAGRITSKDVYYEWQPNGYFLKKPNIMAEYNNASLNETFKALKAYFTIHPDSVVQFLDFDGQTVTGTGWSPSPILAAASSYNSSSSGMDSIVRIAQELLSGFPVLVTRDSTKYFEAANKRRMRTIFTPTYEWYGAVGGTSFVLSMYWGDNTPNWVFDLFTGAQAKAVIAVHELGHTIGMNHQNSSGSGSGENGRRNIMYSSITPMRNLAGWTTGTNEIFETQDDISIFTSLNVEQYNTTPIGASLNDAGNTPNHARYIRKDQVISNFIGVRDSDYYKIFIPSTQTVSFTASVKSEGSNTYASLDVALDLYSDAGNLITSSSNTTVLNASISQSLTRGYYIIKVRADHSNTNAPQGYLMGHYYLSYTY